MNRLSKDAYGCLLALSAKSRSEDPFTQVGACAVNKNGRVLGTGYNGLAAGMIVEDWMFKPENREKKTDFFIHAESNLFSSIKRGECHTLYLTISPCIKCCQSIAALDIKRVVYLKEYDKCKKYQEFLAFYEIEYEELTTIERFSIGEYLEEEGKKLRIL